ncbi:methyl-accepting chemotaxis protein [Vibrio sp. JC009]|uniref:methyl-accepting chemotaxis protein n=1 Tax=Vibrio sp. JC009 TaxID=2912314 RepID=UPI0023B1B632|nr:methyl-accepting chemotaxis protein [Vibrio sp. JC009]WED23979.1 methyl-accepting chemotaxis protein [Vibrio sp. JC009]
MSLTLLGAQLFAANKLRLDKIEERKQTAQSLVQSVVSQLDHIASLSIPAHEAEKMAKELIGSMRYSSNGYYFLHDTEGTILMHPIKPELDGVNAIRSSNQHLRTAFEGFLDVVRAKGGGFVEYQWPKPGSSDVEQKVSYVLKSGKWHWVVGTGVYISEVNTVFMGQLVSIIGVTLLIVAVMVTISSVISRNIIAPLNKITRTMSHIAENKDLTASMESRGTDELSVMATAFNTMNENVKQVVSSISQNTVSLASQAEELATISDHIQLGISKQKQRTNEVTRNIENLSASADTVSESADVVLESAQKSSESVSDGKQHIQDNIVAMDEITQQVNEAVSTSHSLEQCSGEIDKILEVIQQIADQTNLLALNASIEAARAGEHGRGFSVVADEVRTLATQTKESTENILKVMSSLQQDIARTSGVMVQCKEKTVMGMECARACDESLSSIENTITVLTATAKEIHDSTSHQREQAHEIFSNMESIAEIAEQTDHGSQQTNTSTSTLNQMVQDLNALTQSFKF